MTEIRFFCRESI